MRKKQITFLILFALPLMLFACKNSNLATKDNLFESTCIDKPIDTNLISEKETREKDDSWYKSFRMLKFGKFEQDGNVKNGKEDISWLILSDTGSERILISKDVLYAMPFDDKIDVDENNFNQDWEKSSLRKWLNEDFFDIAFDDEEKHYIMTSTVKNGKVFGINNSDEPSEMGKDTFDNVYILSKDEIRKYLGFESDGWNENYLAKPSNYAAGILGEEKNEENFAVWHKEQDYEEVYGEYAEYWIRSSLGYTNLSDREFFTDIVDKRGHVSNHGFTYYVSKTDKGTDSIKERFYSRGVRPVIKISGTSLFEKDHFNPIREEKEPKVYDIKKILDAYEIANYDKSKTYKDFDSVVLGSYEQDGDIGNGKEGIEWLVLNKEDNRALLLSKYILDYVEYSNILERYTVWKDSRLRAMSNHEFYDGVFSEKEKVLIASTKIKNYDNPVYGNSSGPQTIDKIFVPGYDELMDAFELSYDDCIREPFYDQVEVKDERLTTVFTDYALKKYQKDNYNTKSKPQPIFWLRNQGRNGEKVNSRSSNAMTANQTIDFKGSAYDLLQYATSSSKEVLSNPKLGFRPCLWVDLSLLDEFEGESYDSRTDKIFTEDIPEQVKYSFEDIDEARVVTAYNNKATIENFDTVTFGSYEQDGNIDNGKEDIEWIVLDKKDGEYLLLSKFVLDHYKFQSNKVDGITIAWNNSEIRTWANSEFLEQAFSENEKKNIMLSVVDNTINNYYNLKPTEDRVFLLSIDEIIKYFGNKNEDFDGAKKYNYVNANDKTKAFATNYSRSRGVIIGGKKKMFTDLNVYPCGYYTRTMRDSNYNQVLYIEDNGSDGYVSVYDNWTRYGFRPAIWVR